MDSQKSALTKSLICFAVLLLVSLGSARPAAAHAVLLRSDPPAEAVLSAAPSLIKLWFSQAVDPTLSRIDLIDVTGQRRKFQLTLDPADASAVQVAPGALSNGVYTVIWQISSDADSHLSSGTFAFYVGVNAGQAAPKAASLSVEDTPLPGDVLLRWVNLLTSAVLIGGFSFWLFVWQPVLPPDETAGLRRLNKSIKRILWVSWFYFGFALVWALLQQTARLADTDLLSAISSPAFGRVLSSRFGMIWVLRLILWIGLGVVIRQAPTAHNTTRNQRVWWVGLTVGGGLLLLETLNSHSVGAVIPVTAIAANWLHLAALAFWGGGLLYFLVMLVGLRTVSDEQRTPLQTDILRAFSNLSRVAVLALLISGLYASYLYVGGGAALLNTLYGQLLIVKLILFGLLLGVAGFNLINSARKLNFRLLHYTTGLEIGLMLGILLIVSIFSDVAPARDAFAAAQVRRAAVAALEGKPYLNAQTTVEIHVTLEISPGYAGIANQFTVRLYDRLLGEPLSNVQSVRLRFLKRDGSAFSELPLLQVADGQYAATGSNLGEPARWSVRVLVAHEGEQSVNFDVAAAAAPPVVAPAVKPNTNLYPEHKSILIAFGLLALIAGGGGVLNFRRWPPDHRMIQPLSAALLLIGLFFVVFGLLLS